MQQEQRPSSKQHQSQSINRVNKTETETVTETETESNHQYDPLIIHIKRKQDALTKPELIS